jgi:carbamoyl-phosphate synthase large subunit
MTRKLLVTSVGSGVGHAILAALRRSEAPWYVVGMNSVAFDAGVFGCDSAWLTPPVSDRAAFEARLIEVVEAEGPALIVPGRDDDLPILAAMRERLAELGAFALVGSPEAVDICGDKYRTAKVFRAAGLPFTETAASREEIEALLDACGFPLLAKPRRGYGSRGVRVLFDRDGIEAVLACGVEMVVQEYLVPRSWNKTRAEITPTDVERDGVLLHEDEVRAQVLLGRSGEVLGSIAIRAELVGGRPIALEVLDEPLLEAVAREGAELLGRHGLIGPCSITGRWLADGSWGYYEVNARFNGATGMRAAFGFNEVEAAWRHFVEGEEKPDCLTFDKDLVVCRYLAETVVRKGDLERLRQRGKWRASS